MPGPNAEGGLHYLLDTFKFPVIGEVSFACSTTEYLWKVPAGITSISAVLIGGGGGGRAGANQNDGAGGGGGGLRWVNGLVVTPGETLRIKAGVGGTGCPTDRLKINGWQFAWGRPGQHSYIASDNNANVPQRVGLSTIIVIAEGGGWDQYVSDQIRTRPDNSAQINETNANKNAATNTVGVGTSPGRGTAFGVYSWGTVGGGDGGPGGSGGGVGGGQDGGGGGAAGYFGDGGRGGEARDATKRATSGKGGGGGGGQYGGGGGADSAGGGGGTGVFWGVGPNGLRSGYYWNGSAAIFDDSGTNKMTGSGGQAGSFGADGKATGCDLILDTDYTSIGPPINLNYKNGSNGNGQRGFNGSVDDLNSVPFTIPNGGLYGGGGGASQTSGQATDETPISGNGGCGHVRILFVARNPYIIREYGAQRTVETRLIGGGSAGVGTNLAQINFYDFDPSLKIVNNVANGWPVWDPEPQQGVYYNLLVNYSSNLPPSTGYLPNAIGISSNPDNYPI